MVAPWYKEAATALKNEGILFGAMNMDMHGERGNSYGVKGICVHVCVCVHMCVYVYFFSLDRLVCPLSRRARERESVRERERERERERALLGIIHNGK